MPIMSEVGHHGASCPEDAQGTMPADDNVSQALDQLNLRQQFSEAGS